MTPLKLPRKLGSSWEEPRKVLLVVRDSFNVTQLKNILRNLLELKGKDQSAAQPSETENGKPGRTTVPSLFPPQLLSFL